MTLRGLSGAIKVCSRWEKQYQQISTSPFISCRVERGHRHTSTRVSYVQWQDSSASVNSKYCTGILLYINFVSL